MSELWQLSAREAVALLRRGEVTPGELVEVALARIEATDGALNALPTLCPERARQAPLQNAAEKGEEPGWLAGLPLAIKDLVEVAGVRTTFASPIHADNVPQESNILVERLEANGAGVLAKSNTPEFGAGAQTFNEVFGTTTNPWNTALTCGGSSGGSAAALAAGQVWLASGSDLGGSLRIPAAFCGVVGFRPSPGRVARHPATSPFAGLAVEGPMGRTVGDTALMLDAMVGQHVRDPISLPIPARSFQSAVDEPQAPLRVAFSRDLGLGPVEPEIADICAAAAVRFEELGATVEEATPDFTDAIECFHVLRAAHMVTAFDELLAEKREFIKPDLVWNIEQGLALDAVAIGRAERVRAALYHRVVDFFEHYDLLLSPAVIVPPFSHEQRYVEEVAGQRYDNYLDWLYLTFVVTLTACPALSLPCGFSQGELPVGLQMIGPPRGDHALLSAATLAEEMFGIAGRLPIDPRI
ncbi:MAG: amidase family protein [Alphaproteobacteria bacterium]|jgi:amidase|nr:amidase family protein [Alphaproteobacteria bacterium]